MGLFGWSYPPGCSGTPYDEPGEAIKLTELVARKPSDVDDVWWDEDGNLVESFHFTVPAELLEPCGCVFGPPLYDGPNYEPCPVCHNTQWVKRKTPIPEHTETDQRTVGECEWDDELSDEDNNRRAAAAYDALKARPEDDVKAFARSIKDLMRHGGTKP